MSVRNKHNDWFQCKQFRLNQRRAGMRVTTHACVFGAWLNLPAQVGDCVLDIGAGTGLLSLFAAQNCAADFDAVEIDAGAAEDARENFSASPWAGRLHVQEMPIQLFAETTAARYAHVISNPPFFAASLRNDCEKRRRARHDDDLNFQELFAAVDALLQPQGQFHVLIPVEAAERLANAAGTYGFHLARETGTRSLPHKPVTRLMQVWARHAVTPLCEAVTPLRDTLTLYGAYPQYSEPVRAMLAPYYVSL